jgi:hypothetical protein
VQFAGGVKPETVKSAGSLSDAVVSVDDVDPVVQVRPTVTSAGLLSEKFFCTWNTATLSVFRIVQVPDPVGAPLIVPLQVPVEV